MTANRNQILSGLTEYITREVAPNIPDKLIRIELSMLTYALKTDPSIADRLLNIPAVRMLMPPDENGQYPIDLAVNGLREALIQNGQLSMDLPSTSLFSKERKTLSFGPADIDKLRSYIERADVNG